MSAVNDRHLAMKALENAIFLLQCSPIPRSRRCGDSEGVPMHRRVGRRDLLEKCAASVLREILASNLPALAPDRVEVRPRLWTHR